jgi:hypothetical protein
VVSRRAVASVLSTEQQDGFDFGIAVTLGAFVLVSEVTMGSEAKRHQAQILHLQYLDMPCVSLHWFPIETFKPTKETP